MALLLSRMGWVLALALAPKGLSPEPAGYSFAALVFGVVALVVPLGLLLRIAHLYGTIESKIASFLWVIASIALLVAARRTLLAGAPALSAYYAVAPFVWVALGGFSAAMAAHYLGASFKNKRAGAIALVLAAGILLFKDAHALIASERDQWKEVLKRYPAHPQALAALGDDALRGEGGPQIIGRCLSADARACRCRLADVERAVISGGTANEGLQEGLQIAECSGALSIRKKALTALIEALGGRTESAEALLSDPEVTASSEPLTIYARALVASQRQDLETAEALARRAVAGHAGRGAELLLAAVLLSRGETVEAQATLEDLAHRFPGDADATYNLALIADRAGDYNRARERYLKALQERPTLANARYNLALLTLRFGATEEAAHHARKFVEQFPEDERGQALIARTAVR